MMAAATKIVEAVMDVLNDHTFSQEFVAIRGYEPTYELEDMDTLHVTLLMAKFESEPSDRARDKEQHTVHVAVQKRFSRDSMGNVPNALIDPLVDLCEEIRDVLKPQILSAAPEFRRIKTETKPIYDPNHLAKYGQFTGLLAFTYAVTR